jgi:hypothetical protein
VSLNNAERCITDLKKFICWLNTELVSKFGGNGLLKNPLIGFLGHSEADFISESMGSELRLDSPKGIPP